MPLSVYIQYTPSLHLSLFPLLVSTPLTYQGSLSACLQVCGSFQAVCVSSQCGLTEDVFKLALTVMKRLR